MERLSLKREMFRTAIRRKKINGILKSRREQIVREGGKGNAQLKLPEPNTAEMPIQIVSIIEQINEDLLKQEDEAKVGCRVSVAAIEEILRYCTACILKQRQFSGKLEQDQLTGSCPLSEFTKTISLIAMCNEFGSVKLPPSLLSIFADLISCNAGLRVLWDVLNFLAQCCQLPQFGELKSSMILDHILNQLGRWYIDKVIDRLALHLMTFLNSYCSNVGRLPDLLLASQCKLILELCVYALQERYYEYLYELNMKRVIELAVNVLMHLIDNEHCTVNRINYPFERLVEILQHKSFSLKCKTDTLLVLGEAMGQSQHVALTIVHKCNLLKIYPSVTTDYKRELDSIYYNILTRLTVIQQLIPTLESISSKILVDYRLESDVRTKVLMLQFLLSYLEEVIHYRRQLRSKEVQMLELLAEEDQSTFLDQEVQFWKDMVVQWGYRGKLPRFVLQSDNFQDDPQVSSLRQHQYE